MNQQKGFANIVLIVLVIVIVGAISYFVYIQKSNTTMSPPSGTVIPPVTSTLPEIQYEDLNKFDSKRNLACINTFDKIDREKEFVVNTEIEYQDLINYKSSSPQCADFVLPPIDFSQKTLLGRYASGGGCSINFARRVYRDDLNRKIVYVIDVLEEGACEMLGLSSNWILIPKITSGYTVEFQVK